MMVICSLARRRVYCPPPRASQLELHLELARLAEARGDAERAGYWLQLALEAEKAGE